MCQLHGTWFVQLLIAPQSTHLQLRTTLVLPQCRLCVDDVSATQQSRGQLIHGSLILDVFHSQSQGSTYMWIALYVGIYGTF